jgi:imidazolonepropionase-like amidohydrolase
VTARLLIVNSYFDGTTHRNDGPYTFCFEDDRIAAILEGEHDVTRSALPAAFRSSEVSCDRSGFAMPGLVEAHAHLFLKGADLDVKSRSGYLKTATQEERMAVARESADRSVHAGITLIRDAGDRSGINTAIREELAEAEGVWPTVLSAGVALRKPKRYGSFMAREVDTIDEIERAVLESAPCIDQVKVLMTGIIDFESGQVKGKPQFSVEEASRIVEIARAQGLPTFAHCSGLKGIRVAVEAGIDSIEHGFFVDRPTLDEMAEKQIAWVPTFSPVYIQWARPDLIGWGEASVGHLKEILDAHWEHLRYAHSVGVPIICGTDAGSYGVDHGGAVSVELDLMREAGLPMSELLCAATTRPRKRWGVDPGDIVAGARVDIATLNQSPFDDPQAFEEVESVYLNDNLLTIEAEASYQSA